MAKIHSEEATLKVPRACFGPLTRTRLTARTRCEAGIRCATMYEFLYIPSSGQLLPVCRSAGAS